MNKMKKYVSFLLLLTILMGALAGCANKPANNSVDTSEAAVEQPAADESSEEVSSEAAEASEADSIVPEVVVAIGADPADLAPYVGMSYGRIQVLHMIYEYLFDLAKAGEPLTAYIGKSVELTGEKTYTVTIFENIIDSAGNPITAADVAWSYNTGMEMGNLRPLGDIESVTATGDYTVDFVLKNEPGMGDLEKVLCEAPIVSQASYEASPDQFATDPITSSPYVLTEYVPGSSLTFEKRADYWQTDKSMGPKYNQANVQKVFMQIITESAQHAIALETGTADISGSIASDDAVRFSDNQDYSLFTFQDNLTQLMFFNTTEGKAFGNKELRQAVAYAIDTTAMCQAVSPGACTPSVTIGNSNFGSFMDEWKTEDYYAYNLTKAQELLATSGAAEDLTVKLLVQNDARTGLMAQVIQSQLKELGITVEISQVEATVFNQERMDPTAFDFALDAAAGGDFINNPWQLVYDQNRNNGTTWGFTQDDQLQSLLDTIAADFTPETIDAFQQYQKDQAYAYGLLSFSAIVVGVDGVTNVSVDGRGQVFPGACEFSADFK